MNKQITWRGHTLSELGDGKIQVDGDKIYKSMTIAKNRIIDLQEAAEGKAYAVSKERQFDEVFRDYGDVCALRPLWGSPSIAAARQVVFDTWQAHRMALDAAMMQMRVLRTVVVQQEIKTIKIETLLTELKKLTDDIDSVDYPSCPADAVVEVVIKADYRKALQFPWGSSEDRTVVVSQRSRDATELAYSVATTACAAGWFGSVSIVGDGGQILWNHATC